MRAWIATWGFVCASTLASGVEAATLKVGAADLLASSEQAYNATLAAARQSGGRLDPTNPRQAPFWQALARMGQTLQTVHATLASSDPRVFQALRDGSRTLAELRVTWSRIGAPAPAVESQLAALASSYRMLRSGYGREGLRERQGVDLAEEERRWLERWQDSQRRFADQLRILLAQAAERGDFDTVAELQPILEDAERIGEGDPDLDTYLEASLASDTVEGEWEALSDDLAEEYEEEWQTADAIMDQISVESDVGFVLAANLGEVAAYLDEKGEIVEDNLEREGEGEGEKLDIVPEDDIGIEEVLADEDLPSLSALSFDPSLPSFRDEMKAKGAFRLFAGGDVAKAFRLFSPDQRAAPASFWLGLAAGRLDRHGR